MLETCQVPVFTRTKQWIRADLTLWVSRFPKITWKPLATQLESSPKQFPYQPTPTLDFLPLNKPHKFQISQTNANLPPIPNHKPPKDNASANFKPKCKCYFHKSSKFCQVNHLVFNPQKTKILTKCLKGKWIKYWSRLGRLRRAKRICSIQ